jgi:hypothetical protein
MSLQQHAKAIAAVIWALVIIGQRVFKIDLGLDQDTVTLIATALAPVIVYLVPNAPKA